MPLRLFGPYKIFNAQVIAGVTVYRSAPIDMLCMTTAAMEVVWTGNPTGTLSVDGSNNGTVWYPTGTNVHNPIGLGATDDTLIGLSRVEFRYLTLSYSNTAGAGTLTVTATAKGPA